MNRRHLAVALLALVSLAPAAHAADPAPKPTAWEDLMPKDWDPLKKFRTADAGAVQEGSARERDMMREMREIWDNAPTNPKLNGTAVRLPGYVVPLEEVKGELKEFLLVPYFGACIHSPPPPANQIVHVVAATPVKGVRTMDAVWVTGTLKVARLDSAMGVSAYQIGNPSVEPYVAPKR
jgi:hypothetical protein